MSSEVWGLSRSTPPGPESRQVTGRATGNTGKAKLSPKVAQAAHSGIVWIHLSAIVIWLFVAAILGILAAAGRGVPAMVIVAGIGAAAGHAIFLATHWFLASLARKRAARLTTD